MRKIVLIGCVKRKASAPALARELYQSDLFRKSLAFARLLNPDAIYILSAKYGLVDLERVIEPYDETLKNKRVAEIQKWAADVLEQLRKVTDFKEDHFVFLAGEISTSSHAIFANL